MRAMVLADNEMGNEFYRGLGFEQTGEQAQDDAYFVVGEQDGDGHKEYVRVRKNRIQGTATLDHYVVINEQSTKESQVLVDDAHKTIDVLEALGHDVRCVVKKDREIHEHDHVTIVIDHVSVLGTFVELQASAKDEAHAATKLEKVAAQIGLEDVVHGKGYPDLLLEQ